MSQLLIEDVVRDSLELGNQSTDLRLASNKISKQFINNLRVKRIFSFLSLKSFFGYFRVFIGESKKKIFQRLPAISLWSFHDSLEVRSFRDVEA